MATTDVPVLTNGEIQQELAWLFQGTHRSHLVAMWGTGAEDVVEVEKAGRFRVVPAFSELQLRDKLPPVLDRQECIVYLVPWTHELPLDIAGRFVHGGRVLRVGRNRRLQALLRVSEADPEAIESRLAEYVLNADSKDLPSYPAGKLTLDGLWNHWLRVRWRAPTEGALGLDSLMAWAARTASGGAFLSAVAAKNGAAMREDLLAWLVSRVSPAAAVVWRAWEQGKGRKLLELATVADAFEDLHDPAVMMWLEVVFGAELADALAGMKPVDAVKALTRDVDFAIAHLRKANSSLATQVIDAANALVLKGQTLAQVVGKSRRLPCGWDATCNAIGDLLVALAAAPSAGAVVQAHDLLHRLENHEFFKGDYPAQRTSFERAEMAVRLAAWLASPHSKPEPSSSAAYAPAETLAKWYCENGGYVDWARARCRGESTGKLAKGMAAICAAADQRRLELDRSFARALRDWLHAGRPGKALLPISGAFESIGARFLGDSKERRLLVVLMDGMAWPQAVEILQSLQDEKTPWGPLAWHAVPAHRIGGSHYPPVIAELPTETPYSRTAFFAGKPMPPGSQPVTSEDPVRWAKNKAVSAFFEAGDNPPLFLRDQSTDGHGSLSADAEEVVKDTSKRVVAIVINAIDASLHGDAQAYRPWKATDVIPLHPLLDAAREAGRAVLLISDHGHVSGAALESMGTHSDGGSRWHGTKDPTAAVSDYEIAVDKKYAWTPKGAEGVVLTCDDQHKYGGGATAGAHGGASLAEVVVPSILIGWEGMEATAQATGDEASLFRVQGLYVPRWWTLDVEEEAAPIEELLTTTPSPKPKGGRKPTAAPESQPALPGVVIEPPRPPTILKALAESKLFQARVQEGDRTEVLKALHYLMQKDNLAPSAAFAAAMGIPPYRVSGWVTTKLGERLNLDGYLVVSFNAATSQVVLHREMLEQLFEVRL